MGKPWGPPGRAGGGVWGEVLLDVPSQDAAPVTHEAEEDG